MTEEDSFSMAPVLGFSSGASGVRIARAGSLDERVWSFETTPLRPESESPLQSTADVVADVVRADRDAVLGLAVVRPELREQSDDEIESMFDGVHLVSETAAAMRAIQDSNIADGFDTIAIYDLGSSGLSVSIVDVGRSVELGAARSTVVSGDFLDRGVREHLVANGIIGEPDTPAADAEVTAFCRGVKESLSTSVLAQTPGGGTMLMSRSQFDQMASLPLEESAKIVSEIGIRCRRSAQAVVLIGGGSHIPLVTTILSRWLSVPVLLPDEPTMVIAKGAALLAAPHPSTDAAATPDARTAAAPIGTANTSAFATSPLVADGASVTSYTATFASDVDAVDTTPTLSTSARLRTTLASWFDSLAFRMPGKAVVAVASTLLAAAALWSVGQSASDGPSDSDGLPESTSSTEPPVETTQVTSEATAPPAAGVAAVVTPTTVASPVTRTSVPYRYPANQHVEGSVPGTVQPPRETLDISVPFPLPDIRLPVIPRLAIPGL